jgi:hypothetical protein
VREDDDYFTCITKAFEILGNPVRRRAFDSVDPLFDDTVPAVLAKDKAEADFFATFGPVFDRNARWSNKTPVPLLGMPAATVSVAGGSVHDRSESVSSFFIQCRSESRSGQVFCDHRLG